MSLVLFFICVIALVVDDKHKATKINRKVSAMNARGEFLPQNYSKFNAFWDAAADDWIHDRKMFPKEYWAYFERNEKAKNAYIEGLVGQQEMKEGLKPVLHNATYNKDTFDPFGVFDSYKEKIKEYNETGKLYF